MAVAVALVPECWKHTAFVAGGKNNGMVVGCWVLCSCLSNRFLSLPRLIYTLVEERKSDARENLFVMSIRVSHLCCNSSISFTLLFFMGKAYDKG